MLLGFTNELDYYYTNVTQESEIKNKREREREREEWKFVWIMQCTAHLSIKHLIK